MARPRKNHEFIKEIDGNFIRICPTCHGNIIHKSRIGSINCHKQKRSCGSCANKSKIFSPEKKREIGDKISKGLTEFRKTNPPWNTGLTKETSDTVALIAKKRTGKLHTEEVKRLIAKTSKDRWDSGFYSNIFNTPPEFFKYQSKVHKLTRLVSHLVDGYDKNKQGRAGVNGAYQIDHIVTIKYGFENGISPEEIAKLSNLRFITWEENLKRRSRNYVKKSNV